MQVRVFDIDDTLCDDGSVLCDRTRSALLSLKRKGEGIHFASARHWITTMEALQIDELHSHDAVVATENGGRIFRNGKLIQESLFSVTERALIIAEMQNVRDRVKLVDYWSGDILYTVSDQVPAGTSDDIHREYVTLERAIQDVADKAVSMIHYLLRATEDMPSSEGHWMPEGVSKAQIYAHLPNEHRILVYGNGDNDIQLFNHAIGIERIAHAVGSNMRLRAVAQRHLETRIDLLELLEQDAQI